MFARLSSRSTPRVHYAFLDTLIIFLAPLLEKSACGTLRSGINVFHERSPKEDYRVPDLTFVARGREFIIAADGREQR